MCHGPDYGVEDDFNDNLTCDMDKDTKNFEYTGLTFVEHSDCKTSSAGSATLEDTSWARPYLASLNLPDSQVCLESKTEPEWKKNYIGGDTAQKKCILGGGDTTHTLLMGGTIGAGTPHTLQTPSRNWYNIQENNVLYKILIKKLTILVKRLYQKSLLWEHTKCFSLNCVPDGDNFHILKWDGVPLTLYRLHCTWYKNKHKIVHRCVISTKGKQR